MSLIIKMIINARLKIEGRKELVKKVRDWLAKNALKAGYNSESINDLNLAVTEATTNIIRHAYGNVEGKPIRFDLSINEESLLLKIEHNGKAFNPRQYKKPDLSRPQAEGYGIFLIKSIMDKVEFEETENGGKIIFEKYRLPDTDSGSKKIDD